MAAVACSIRIHVAAAVRSLFNFGSGSVAEESVEPYFRQAFCKPCKNFSTSCLSGSHISNLDPAFGRHHHIRGFQVAINDGFLVRRGQRLCPRAGNLDDAFEGRPFAGISRSSGCPSINSMVRKWTPSDSSTEYRVTTFGWLRAATARASRWNRANRSGSPTTSRQDLEGYVAPQLYIGGAIHLAHSAGANCGVDPVMCKCTSDQTEPHRVDTQFFVLRTEAAILH